MQKISRLLSDVFLSPQDDIADTLPSAGEDYYTLADIVTLLHERGFGMIALFFAIPIAIPGCPPPIPTILALPLCFICVQMILGYDNPRLPEFIAKRRIKKVGLQKTLNKALPYVVYVEKFIKPRLSKLAAGKSERLLGLIMLIFSSVILIPVPMTNSVPGMAIILISIGILTQDGFFTIGGICTGVAWIILLFFISNELLGYLGFV